MNSMGKMLLAVIGMYLILQIIFAVLTFMTGDEQDMICSHPMKRNETIMLGFRVNCFKSVINLKKWLNQPISEGIE